MGLTVTICSSRALFLLFVCVCVLQIPLGQKRKTSNVRPRAVMGRVMWQASTLITVVYQDVPTKSECPQRVSLFSCYASLPEDISHISSLHSSTIQTEQIQLVITLWSFSAHKYSCHINNRGLVVQILRDKRLYVDCLTNQALLCSEHFCITWSVSI